jgi:hypothetical protein
LSSENSHHFKRLRNIILAVLGIFLLSFAGTDYYLRGQLYYTKRVINFLALHTWQAVFPPSGPVSLYVRLAADQSYRKAHPDWKTRLAGVFEAAAKRYGEAFDIRLTLLNIDAWERPISLTDFAGILKYAARKLDRRGADIFVVMTADDAGDAQDSRWRDAGIANTLGNCIVVGDDALLVHELGHLFGAVDYPPESPLYDEMTTYSYKHDTATDAIDPANRDRILKHKYRPLW